MAGQVVIQTQLLGPGQTSNFTWVELNANEQKPLFELICIEFDSCEVRRLTWALESLDSHYLKKKTFKFRINLGATYIDVPCYTGHV